MSDERAPILGGDAAAAPAPPPFTASTSPPRPAGFDGVAPKAAASPSFLASQSSRRAALAAALAVLFLACVGAWTLVGRAAGAPVRAGVDTQTVPAGARKVGAGVLLWREDDGRFLLLQRKSKHHDATWGLPGGNAESKDGSLLDTAEREAAEEMGGLPPGFSVLHRLDTQRDAKKKDDDDEESFKFYAVFVCRVPASGAAAFKPRLEDDEVRDWRWWSMEDAAAAAARGQLHPVAAEVLVGGGAAELGAVLEGARAGEARGD